MSEHFADRLLAGIQDKGSPICVGLDPLIERLPDELLDECGIKLENSATSKGNQAPAKAFRLFGEEVIRSIAPYAPAIKINIAFFEPYGDAGLNAYSDLIHQAHQQGLCVIGDVKRADIGHTSRQYAVAHLIDRPNEPAPDAITVNPYFGSDGVDPFIKVARQEGRGVFVLVQTSNKSADQVQGLTLSDGGTVCRRVGELVEEWACEPDLIGTSGYSCIGAVVSPRDLPSTERIRSSMPSCLFLVPGFGAQGRTAKEVARCFKSDGTGAIVSASRSVIYAYREEHFAGRFPGDWRGCIRQSCKEFAESVRAVL